MSQNNYPTQGGVYSLYQATVEEIIAPYSFWDVHCSDICPKSSQTYAFLQNLTPQFGGCDVKERLIQGLLLYRKVREDISRFDQSEDSLTFSML